MLEILSRDLNTAPLLAVYRRHFCLIVVVFLSFVCCLKRKIVQVSLQEGELVNLVPDDML